MLLLDEQKLVTESNFDLPLLYPHCTTVVGLTLLNEVPDTSESVAYDHRTYTRFFTPPDLYPDFLLFYSLPDFYQAEL